MKRPTCLQCDRPTSACLCRWVRQTANPTEVLILQHPLEVRNAKGSAILLFKGLARCRLHVGESFDPEALHVLLYNRWDMVSSSERPVAPVLLYPGTSSYSAGDAPTNTRLVVIDATWRKSRKMLYLNPLLEQLPRLALENLGPSRYLVRKAQRAEQRSTLEATCAALEQIETPGASRYKGMLDAFDGFVASLSERMPPKEKPKPPVELELTDLMLSPNG